MIMRFQCQKPDCAHLLFASLQRYLNHVRNNHSHEPNFFIVCPAERCFRSYGVVSSLTSHISRKHKTFGEDTGINLDDDSFGMEVDIAQEPRSDILAQDCDIPHNISVKTLVLNAVKAQELNRVSDIATDNILQNTFELLEQNDNYVKQGIKRCLKDSGINLENVSGLPDLFDSSPHIAEAAQQLKSSIEWNRYLVNEFKMVVSS